MVSVDGERVKCACTDCVCMVTPDKAVTRGEQAFCCDECADGHKDHAGCQCHG